MNKPYTPRADSLASQVIGFFTSNPQAELLLEDITEQFDCIRGNIHTLLRPAVEAGMLVRKQNDDGDYVYSFASSSAKKMRKVVRKTDDILTTAASGKSPAAAAELPDPADVAIEDNIPIPAGRGAIKLDWSPVLKKLKLKQSFKLPITARHTLAANVTDCHKTGSARFSTRTFKDTQEVRVWRIS